jgi:cytochrome c oxidase subunit II
MFSGASNFNKGTDTAFMVIFGITLVFFISITAIMITFVVKYNRKRKPEATQIKDIKILEITWTAVPLLLVLLMFYYGYIAFTPMNRPPKDALRIKTTGRMWVWSFDYGKGRSSKILVVPINKPVRLDLESKDVIHSLYIPAFRIKEDVVPGKNNFLWFIPEKTGEYDILCSQYCGLQHSYMETKIKVVSDKEYSQWLTTIPKNDVKTEPAGLMLIKNNACIGCHSLDGSKLVSSSFKGLFGKKHAVTTNGVEKNIIVDSSYIANSIYEPDHDIVKGYNKGIMKSYKGIIKETEVVQIIDYLKSLHD